ncbi:MAG: addiction module protein [Phycisphaerales bacterium]
MTERQRIFDVAQLSAAERLLLAGELLDMAHMRPQPLSPAQMAEVRRRDARADSNPNSCEPWEEVREQLKPRG